MKFGNWKVLGIIALTVLLAIGFVGCGERKVVTPEPEITPIVTQTPVAKVIEGLASVHVFLPVVKNWDRDPEPDGVEIPLTFEDQSGNWIFFDDIPVVVEVKLYSMKWDREKGEFVGMKI